MSGGRINYYKGVCKVTKGIPSLIIVNKTAGTASGITNFIIIIT
jgi:alcohol dehydrogenase class IV